MSEARGIKAWDGNGKLVVHLDGVNNLITGSTRPNRAGRMARRLRRVARWLEKR